MGNASPIINQARSRASESLPLDIRIVSALADLIEDLRVRMVEDQAPDLVTISHIASLIHAVQEVE